MHPVRIGILTEATPRRSSKEFVWPETTHAHLTSIFSPDEASVCIVHPIDVDITEGLVRGWVYSKIGGWSKQTQPMPHVLYNRIARRSTENSEACRRFLRRIQRAVPLFNPRFLQKDEVHRALTRSDAAEYWPRTWVVTHRSASDRWHMIQDASELYLKPISGSLGRGIVFLRRLSDGYAYRRNVGISKEIDRGVLRTVDVRAALRSWFFAEPFLLQEGISKTMWHGRSFDMRILMQKDRADQWSMTGIAGRVAAKNAVTTHLPRGGSQRTFAKLRRALPHLPPADRWETVAKKVLSTVERGCGITLFEASIDAGADREGRLYVFDVNAKPFPFDEPIIQRRAARRLAAYARHVAGLKPLERPVDAPLPPDLQSHAGRPRAAIHDRTVAW